MSNFALLYGKISKLSHGNLWFMLAWPCKLDEKQPKSRHTRTCSPHHHFLLRTPSAIRRHKERTSAPVFRTLGSTVPNLGLHRKLESLGLFLGPGRRCGGAFRRKCARTGDPCSVACILHGVPLTHTKLSSAWIRESSFPLGPDKTGAVHLVWCEWLDWAPQTHETHDRPTKVQIQL